jgi:hypothetical protein
MPRFLVPASGRFVTINPPPALLLTRHRISGLDATRMHPDACRYTMYGLGFTARSARYTSNGSALLTRSNRCPSTTWKMSPARMYSFARATIDACSSRVMLLDRAAPAPVSGSYTPAGKGLLCRWMSSTRRASFAAARSNASPASAPGSTIAS